MAGPIAYTLLSGGIDSTTALARARALHDEVRCVSVDYGQRHRRELESAERVAAYYNCEWRLLQVSLPRTMLTDEAITVPAISYSEITGVSPTYVPFRNGTMLSQLTAHIAGRHLDPTQEGSPDYMRYAVIYAGMHAEDAAGGAYPDCSVEFCGAMACAIERGTYGKVRLVVPFINMMKHEIVAEGARYPVVTPYELTWSCYRGGAVHCGECATCRARRAAFDLARVPDPTEYLVP